MLKKHKVRGLMNSVCAIALCAGPAASAQGDEGFTLEEVVVTAQKRESNLTDTPIAITAITGDQIDQRGVQMFEDIASSMPSVSFNNTTELTNNRITIRGVSNFQQSPSIDPANAFYVDEVFMGSDLGSQITFFDVERVEVLRGPQGTLFGRNSVGGAINVITRKPENEFSGSAALSVGNYDSRKVDFAINAPIAEDKILTRFSFSHSERGGFTHNTLDNSYLNDFDRTSFRGRIDFLMSETFRTSLSMDYASSEQSSRAFDVMVDGYGIDSDPMDRKVSILDHGGEDFEGYGGSLTMEWDLDNMSVKSITSYRDIDYQREINAVGVPMDLARDAAPEQSDTFSQELRFTSASDGALQWVAGLFYFDRSLDFEAVITLGAATGGLAGLTQERAVETKNKSVSAYAHVTYDFDEKTHFGVGLRQTNEKKEMDLTLAGALRGAAVGNGFYKADWSATTPMATFRYDVSDQSNIYLTYSQGFKSGGFNELVLADAAFMAYDPEKVHNYEFGAKGRLMDDRLEYAAAIYHTVWKGLQVEQLINGGNALFQTLVSNTGRAVSNGAEFELTWLATRNLRLDFDVAYNDGEIKKSDSTTVLAGNRLTDSPEWAWVIAADYEKEISDKVTLFAAADYSWRGDTYVNSPDNNPLAFQEDYGLLNAQFGFRFVDSKYSLYLWGKNLGDEDVYTRVFDLTSNSLARRALVTLNAPRTWGLTLTGSF